MKSANDVALWEPGKPCGVCSLTRLFEGALSFVFDDTLPVVLTQARSLRFAENRARLVCLEEIGEIELRILQTLHRTMIQVACLYDLYFGFHGKPKALKSHATW